MEQVVYKIINLVTDKFYLGSTSNKKVRFRQHRRFLRQNRHHCKHLQASWNLYGESKFAFEVVEVVPEGQNLFEAEQRWLDAHFGKPHCYNSGAAAIAPWRGIYGTAHPNYGKTLPETTKAALSEASNSLPALQAKREQTFEARRNAEIALNEARNQLQSAEKTAQEKLFNNKLLVLNNKFK